MSYVACKKCPNCGLINDISVNICKCGSNMIIVPAKLVDTDTLLDDQYGEIDENVPFYLQKCSECGVENYTADASQPVKICFNCHKSRISRVSPVLFKNNTDDSDSQLSYTHYPSSNSVSNSQNDCVKVDDDDDDDDDQVAFWGSVLGNIVGEVSDRFPQKENGIAGNGDSEEMQSSPKSTMTLKTMGITLKAIRYGNYTLTYKAKDGCSYMLGRSADGSDFLSQDLRVGNEHCTLNYKSGVWFVRDNHSSNGTFVNSNDIGLNGECALHDGDILVLGHNLDSIAFKVSIE